MQEVITLSQFLNEEVRRGQIKLSLAGVVTDMARAGKIISQMVGRGALANILGYTERSNIQGETQTKLDILANDIILKNHEWGGYVAAMASEEMDSIYLLPLGSRRGDYLLVFDPLDGSTNIDVNGSIGTIFSVLPVPAGVNEPREEHFLQPGINQVCAGYMLYGPATLLLLTLGYGVHSFNLDREIGEFILIRSNMQIPEATSEFAINSSNARFWETPVQRYINECIAGSEGVRGRNFNMRWSGAMVADTHRCLSRGGVFLYPKDRKDPKKPGKLRLLYEANPVSFMVEQAKGLSSTGYQRVLEIEPSSLHQRVPLILGSAQEVQRLIEYHSAGDAY